MSNKLKEEDFRKLVREIIKESAKELGTSLDQNMNKMIGVNTKKHPNALIGTEKNKNVAKSTGSALDVKMSSNSTTNKKDTLVGVQSVAKTKKGDSIEGMSNAKFSTKTNKLNSEDATGVDMNKMDKEIDKGTKTFVQSGSANKNGQKEPKWSEVAKNDAKKAPIATAIQLPENFNKKIVTSSDLMKLINEEARKISKLI